jgi:hypothetical protein
MPSLKQRLDEVLALRETAPRTNSAPRPTTRTSALAAFSRGARSAFPDVSPTAAEIAFAETRRGVELHKAYRDAVSDTQPEPIAAPASEADVLADAILSEVNAVAKSDGISADEAYRQLLKSERGRLLRHGQRRALGLR